MEIEILMQDALEANINYFEKLFFNPGGSDVEIKEVESFSADCYKIIDYATYDKLADKRKLSKFFISFNGVDFNSSEALARLGMTTPDCLGVIDTSKDVGFYVPFISSFLNGQEVVNSQKQLLKKLNGVMQSVLGQLQRVKGLHEKVVPVRNESIRGLNINSRFCAGTSSGGEFFDFFKSGSNLWLFSINASSYITIGSFLSLIESWKTASSLEKDFVLQNLNSVKNDFSGLGDMSIFIGKVDLSNYEMEIINIGEHELVSKNKVVTSRNDQAYPDKIREMKEMTIQLERGEQLILLSPGFFKNSGETLNSESYFQFIKSNWAVASDMIQELTFQSKKKYNDLDFMPYDQTILSIGVDKNAISKI